MAKIARKFQKIFGINAASNQIAKVGSLAAAAPVRYSGAADPDDIQALSNFESGWFSTVIGSNSPAIEDRNALDLLITRQLAYLFQAGIPEWDTDTEYHIGSRVTVGGQETFVSLTNTNQGNNPETDDTNWGKADIQPGTMMAYAGSTAPTGYVLASARTIGNGSSGGTERANDDTYRLFKLLWNDYSDTLLPIQDSGGGASTRGADADTDWAANKRITLPDARGRVIAGKDDMGGSAASRLTSTVMTPDGATLGAAGGTETHTLSSSEMPSHTHSSGSYSAASAGAHTHDVRAREISSSSHSHLLSNDSSRTACAPTSTARTVSDPALSAGAHTHSVSGTSGSAGSGGAHLNTQPTLIQNMIIKL